MKRALLILTPFLLVVTGLVFLIHLISPSLERWAIHKIREESAQYSPVEIETEHLSWSFFPPSLTADGIEVAAKNPDEMGFSYVSVETLEAQIDLLQLLVGKFAISDLIIESPDVDIKIDHIGASGAATAAKLPQRLDLSAIFERLKIIPIHRVLVNHLSADITYPKQKLRVSIVEANALLVNELEAIAIEAEFPADPVIWDELRDSLYLRVGGILRPNSLEISRFHCTLGATDIQMTADLTHPELLLSAPTGTLHLELQSDLTKLKDRIHSEIAVPDFEGLLKIKSDLYLGGKKVQTGNLSIDGHGLGIDQYRIGDLHIEGTWANDAFTTSSVQITNSAALVDLNSLILRIEHLGEKPHISFEADLSADTFDLNELLQVIKVGDLPLELIANGNAHCDGDLAPNLDIHCQAESKVDFFEVGSGAGLDKNIVQVDDLAVAGKVEITPSYVKVQGHIQKGETAGDADGVVSFADGFIFNYNANNFDFSDIKRLAGLDLKGHGKLSGQTTGNTKTAQFYIDADAHDLWFQDFYLGSAKTQARYAKGNLQLADIAGFVNSSHYAGEVNVDLLKPEIFIDMESGSFDVNDGTLVIQNKLKLPVEVSGPVSIKAKGHGPLKLGELSYDVRVQGKHVIIANEALDSLDFGLHSENGQVDINHFVLSKNHSILEGRGSADPKGMINLQIEGKPLYLEDSDNISRLNSNVFGQLSMDLRAKGFILDPDVMLRLRTQNVVLEENEMAPSEAEFRITRAFTQGNINLLSGKLRSQFQLPNNDSAPMYFEASSRDWDFTKFFILFGNGPVLADYRSSLTGDLALRAEHGGWFNSDGQGTLMRFELTRGNVSLKNPGAMDLYVKQGQLSLQNFRIAGEESYLEIDSKNSSKHNLSLKILSRLQLHVAQLFFPFMEELSGLATFKVNIIGDLEQPEVLGSGTLQDGYVKLKSFPHAFEKLNSSVQFSQHKIIFNEITGNLGGGSFEGEGDILISGPRNLPTHFHFDAENMTLNVPEKIKTSGSGEFDVSGNWFPFLLSGTYHIRSGLMTREFDEDSASNKTQQSSYLPKIILQSAFEPLLLDIKLLLEGPFEVRNSMLEGKANGNLQITGPPSAPILAGKLSLEKNSKFNFRYNSFDIANASAVFNNSKEINPEIYIAATSHIADYDVSLIAQGTSKSPSLKLSSIPPLADQDIVSLMALGMTSNNVDHGSATLQKDQQQNSNTQLGAAVFSSISKSYQKAAGVDIQVSSQYDDTKSMATQKYSISKKLTDQLTISAGATRGDESDETYQLKYSINPNVSISTSLQNLEPPTTGSPLAPQTQGQVLGVDLEYKREFH